MRRQQIRGISSVILLEVVGAAGLRAAPGDVISRIQLPFCGSPEGLAFDGSLLYYTLAVDPSPATVYRVEAATGADRGSFLVTQAGNPVAGVGGLGWDSNRGLLWAFGGWKLFLVSPESGEVVKSLWVIHGEVPQRPTTHGKTRSGSATAATR